MPPYTGRYSRFMYREEKEYLAPLLQTDVYLVDADFNDWALGWVTFIRRFVQYSVGDGAFGTSFQIQQSTSTANNFKVKGGDGTTEGSGRAFATGYPCMLLADVEYKNAVDEIHPIVTGVSDPVLTDSAANWTVNELVGRDLCPDVDFPATVFPILSNTVRTITVAGGLLAATSVGKHYRVNLSTPVAPRTDIIYLDAFLDEVSSAEDPDLAHDIAGPTECMRRLKVRHYVRVREGSAVVPSNYVDVDGNHHAILLLATINRTATADILTAMLVDERLTIDGFSTIKNEVVQARGTRFVLNDRLSQSLDGNGDLLASQAVKTLDVTGGYLTRTGGPAGIVAVNLLESALLSDATPAVPTTGGSPGVGTKASRSDHAHPIGAALIGNLLIEAQSVPNDTVRVNAGTVIKSDGTRYFAVGAVPAFGGPVVFPAPIGAARTDLIMVDDTGSLVVQAGVEGGGTPGYPTTGKTVLYQVVISEVGGPVVISPGDLTDVRPWIRNYVAGAGSGGQTDTVVGSSGITNIGNNVNANLRPTYGVGANTVCQGNDSRLFTLAPATHDTGWVSWRPRPDGDKNLSWPTMPNLPRLIQAYASANAGGSPCIKVAQNDNNPVGPGGFTIYNITTAGCALSANGLWIWNQQLSIGARANPPVPDLSPDVTNYVRILVWA